MIPACCVRYTNGVGKIEEAVGELNLEHPQPLSAR
jgi:hypothetical protein